MLPTAAVRSWVSSALHGSYYDRWGSGADGGSDLVGVDPAGSVKLKSIGHAVLVAIHMPAQKYKVSVSSMTKNARLP